MGKKINSGQKPDDNWGEIVCAIIIFIFILFFICLVSRFHRKKKSEKEITTKGGLAKYYDVHRTVLEKWIHHFTSIDVDSLERKRKLKPEVISVIISELGEVTDSNRPFKKKDICAAAETSYRVIRENLKINPSVYGAMDIFPPKIGKQIIAHLG